MMYMDVNMSSLTAVGLAFDSHAGLVDSCPFAVDLFTVNDLEETALGHSYGSRTIPASWR